MLRYTFISACIIVNVYLFMYIYIHIHAHMPPTTPTAWNKSLELRRGELLAPSPKLLRKSEKQLSCSINKDRILALTEAPLYRIHLPSKDLPDNLIVAHIPRRSSSVGPQSQPATYLDLPCSLSPLASPKSNVPSRGPTPRSLVILRRHHCSQKALNRPYWIPS